MGAVDIPHGTSGAESTQDTRSWKPAALLPTGHHAQAPAVLDHSRTLPQGDGRAGPAFTRRAVGSECNLIVLDACDVLHDAGCWAGCLPFHFLARLGQSKRRLLFETIKFSSVGSAKEVEE